MWNKRVFLSFTSWTLVAVAMVFALIAAVRYRVAKYKRRAVEEAFNFYMDEGCQNTREHEDVTKVLRELEMLKF